MPRKGDRAVRLRIWDSGARRPIVSSGPGTSSSNGSPTWALGWEYPAGRLRGPLPTSRLRYVVIVRFGTVKAEMTVRRSVGCRAFSRLNVRELIMSRALRTRRPIRPDFFAPLMPSLFWQRLTGTVGVECAPARPSSARTRLTRWRTHLSAGSISPRSPPRRLKARRFPAFRELGINAARFDPRLTNVIGGRDGTLVYIVTRGRLKNLAGRSVVLPFCRRSHRRPTARHSLVLTPGRGLPDALNFPSRWPGGAGLPNVLNAGLFP